VVRRLRGQDRFGDKRLFVFHPGSFNDHQLFFLSGTDYLVVSPWRSIGNWWTPDSQYAKIIV
jgi:hypothetical protein